MIEIQQINVTKSVFQKLKTPSILAVILIFIFSLVTFKFWISWQANPFQNDVDQYYSYLVAQFIHHDFSFSFKHEFWLIETPTHHLVPKVTMGLAFLYLPFFVIADNIAYAYDYDGLGYSSPYGLCIHFGSIFYSLIGFWYTRKSLLIFFNEWITSLSMLLILFATNLFNYIYRDGEMSHSYLFFLFSVFMFHSIKWNFSKRNKHLYFMAFIAGFITLIRPTKIIVILIPVLYQVTSVKAFKEKLNYLVSLKWKWLIITLLFLIPLIPQLIFWKVYTGQFLFFSYGSSEGFFFLDPKFYSVLFGWRKGWFIYTPIMIFAIVGLIMMFKKWKNMFIPVSIYLAVNIYLISSWWDWGFGGAHGMRALVQSYAFLIFPFAFFLNWLFQIKKIWLKSIVIPIVFSVFGFFIYLNLFQVWLLKNAVMHWDSMTRDAYVYTSFKTGYSPSERVFLESLFKHPNYDEMRKGKRDE